MSTTSTNLASHFNRATLEGFWHYVAKNHFKESTYQNEKSLKARIEEIRKKLGECSFDRQAAYGWTPLHVAVLSNNTAGIRFFLRQGAKVDIQDNEGKTSLEYASHSPELLSLFLASPEELIKKFITGSLKIQVASTAAHVFIEQLAHQSKTNISLAREGLCHLLKLNIEEVQLKVVQNLKPLLSLQLLGYDVDNDQSRELIALERQLNEVMGLCYRSQFPDLFLSLVDLYQDILERLWLLPYLVEDRSSYTLIIEQHGHLLRNEAVIWQRIFEKESLTKNKFTVPLRSLLMIFQRIYSFSSKLIKSIQQLKLQLKSPYISVFVGEICQDNGDFKRAIHHYRDSLGINTNFLKVADSAEQKKCKNIERSQVLNQLGIAYNSLGKFRKAVNFFE